MFVWKLKLRHPKLTAAAAAAAVMIAASAAAVNYELTERETPDEAYSVSDSSADEGKTFLRSLGLEAQKLEDSRQVVIPEEFDSVYEDYNSLQEISGFDLSGYRGKTVEKLTYRLRGAGAEYAVLLLSRGRVIGGHLGNMDGGKAMPLSQRRTNGEIG